MPTYKLSKNAVLETFEDGGLVLILPDRRLVELNPTAVEVVKLLDGIRAPEQIADEIVKQHDISHDVSVAQIKQDVLELCVELNQNGVLEIQPDRQESVDMTTAVATQFLCNPDVVLREEDEDGGLLFNPDTNQVKVINTTGLFIWQQCGVMHTLDEIVAEVQREFDDVPTDQVAQDVQEFVDGMLATGFIGTVVE
jgi:hypothetical protein